MASCLCARSSSALVGNGAIATMIETMGAGSLSRSEKMAAVCVSFTTSSSSSSTSSSSSMRTRSFAGYGGCLGGRTRLGRVMRRKETTSKIGFAAARSSAEMKTEGGSGRMYKVTLLPGDGIGPEIMKVAVEVLEMVGKQEGIEFEFAEALVGGAAIDAFENPLPDHTLELCRSSDAVLLAAIGGYKWDSNPPHLRPERGLLGLRAGLGAFANLRPASVLPQLIDASSLKREVVEGVDIMVVRELTGGIYFGQPKGFGENENGDRIGFNNMVYSVPEIDRIARVGFEAARKRGGKLCSVDKANVLETSQLWRETVTQLGKEEYPDVELTHMYVDNAAMQLIRAPKQFDTIVTGNLFGDILSDEASMLTGSIGMLPSASVGESGPGLFEPVHGSAPDIAGQDKANPLAQVLSAAMMLRYGLNEPVAAQKIEDAVLQVLDQGYRTGDIMSPGMKLVGCVKMGEILLDTLSTISTPAAAVVA